MKKKNEVGDKMKGIRDDVEVKNRSRSSRQCADVTPDGGYGEIGVERSSARFTGVRIPPSRGESHPVFSLHLTPSPIFATKSSRSSYLRVKF